MNAYRDSYPFSNSVPVHGISKILWSNYSYHQSDSKANIQIPPPQNQASDQDATIPSIKDVSIVKKPLKYPGFYVIITELGDLTELDEDEVDINYLKSYGHWVIIEKDLDSRIICELKYVETAIDNRSCFTITE